MLAIATRRFHDVQRGHPDGSQPHQDVPGRNRCGGRWHRGPDRAAHLHVHRGRPVRRPRRGVHGHGHRGGGPVALRERRGGQPVRRVPDGGHRRIPRRALGGGPAGPGRDRVRDAGLPDLRGFREHRVRPGDLRGGPLLLPGGPVGVPRRLLLQHASRPSSAPRTPRSRRSTSSPTSGATTSRTSSAT